MSGTQGAPGAVNIQIVPGPEFAALAERLKGPAQEVLRKATAKRIREACKPVEAALREAVKNVPTGGARGGGRSSRATARFARSKTQSEGAARRARNGAGLRDTIAGAIQTKLTLTGPRAGVVIRVDGTKLPPEQRGLPKYLDGMGRWRHQVFGRDVYVTQTGTPYWEPVITRMRPQLEQDMQQIMSDVVAELDRSL